MPKDRFPDVQRNVADRTGQAVYWTGHGQDQKQIDSLVGQILWRPLSADDAVRVALLNNQNLQADFDELGVARADVLQAGLIQNPVLNVIPRFPDKPPSGIDIEVSVEEDFVSLLALPARKELAATQYDRAALQTADKVLDLAAQTRSVFYSYQAAGQTLRLRQSVVASLAASADTSRQLRDAGNISDLDWAGQEAMYEQARIDLQSADDDVQDQRERLNELMGLEDPGPTDWTPEPNLADLPADEIPLENLENIAMQKRFDLAAAQRQVAAASQALGLANRLRFLSDASIGIDSERGTNGQTVTGPTISLPIPIFDNGQARAMAARAKLDEVGAQYSALAVQIRSEVRRARNHLLSARSRVESYQTVLLPLHAIIVDESLKHYNGMLLGVFQLLQARQNQIDAQRAEIESLRDYWMARAELARALGGNLPETLPADVSTSQSSTQATTHP